MVARGQNYFSTQGKRKLIQFFNLKIIICATTYLAEGVFLSSFFIVGYPWKFYYKLHLLQDGYLYKWGPKMKCFLSTDLNIYIIKE